MKTISRSRAQNFVFCEQKTPRFQKTFSSHKTAIFYQTTTMAGPTIKCSPKPASFTDFSAYSFLLADEKHTKKFFLCSLYLGLFFSCSSSSSSSPELSSSISLSSAWIPPFLLFFLLPLFFLKIKKETIFETKSRKISSLKAEPEPSAFFYWNCGRPSAFWLEPEPPCFGRSLSYPVLAGA